MESGLAGSHEARGSLPGNKVFWLNPLAGFLSSALVSFTSVGLFFSELQNG